MSKSKNETGCLNELEQKIRDMNDIFILRPNGKIAYINYETYSDPSRIVESVSETKDSKFFMQNDGGYPSNLYGPMVTKVIDWNVLDTPNEYKNHPVNSALKCKPGYYINLRRMTLDRLEAATTLEDQSKLKNDDPLVLNGLASNAAFYTIPSDLEHQLENVPVEDNVYIAFYEFPEKRRSSANFYSYHVSYFTAAELDSFEYELCSPCAPEDHNYTSSDIDNTKRHLESHYGKTKVQSGAVNPDDQLLAFACYVANIRTFL